MVLRTHWLSKEWKDAIHLLILPSSSVILCIFIAVLVFDVSVPNPSFRWGPVVLCNSLLLMITLWY